MATGERKGASPLLWTADGSASVLGSVRRGPLQRSLKCGLTRDMVAIAHNSPYRAVIRLRNWLRTGVKLAIAGPWLLCRIQRTKMSASHRCPRTCAARFVASPAMRSRG